MVLLKRWPVEHSWAGGRETGSAGTRKSSLNNICTYVIFLLPSYKFSCGQYCPQVANVTNLLNMRKALYYSSNMAVWEKRSERSQNERLDPKGRKKSRTSVFATKAPAVDQDTQHVTGPHSPSSTTTNAIWLFKGVVKARIVAGNWDCHVENRVPLRKNYQHEARLFSP